MPSDYESGAKKTIDISIKAEKMTADVLKSALQEFMSGKAEKKGRMTYKQLQAKSPSKLDSIEVSDRNIGDFLKTARKYDVDFALKRDKSTSPPQAAEKANGRVQSGDGADTADTEETAEDGEDATDSAAQAKPVPMNKNSMMLVFGAIALIGVGGAGFFLMKKKNGGGNSKSAMQDEPEYDDDNEITEDDMKFYDDQDDEI